MTTNLCVDHRQETNYSHFDPYNCAVCQLLKKQLEHLMEIDRLATELKNMKTEFFDYTHETSQLRDLMREASCYFSIHSFEGRKLEWINRANALLPKEVTE